MMKKKTLLLVIALLSLVISCQKPAKLEVEPKEITFFSQGETKDLKVKAFDKNNKQIEKVKLEFKSTNEGAATVDNNGKVTAVKTGDATIEIKTKNILVTVPVKVIIPEAFKIGFPEEGVFEATGPEKSTFNPLIIAKDQYGKNIDLSYLKFSSSKPDVATINENGEMTLLNDGVTTIVMELGKKKASLDIPVVILKPSAVKVDSSRFTISVGEKGLLPFTVISSKGTELKQFPVKIEFEKDGIATSNEYGEVTGIAPGTTKVTIKAGDSSNTLTLTVK